MIITMVTFIIIDNNDRIIIMMTFIMVRIVMIKVMMIMMIMMIMMMAPEGSSLTGTGPWQIMTRHDPLWRLLHSLELGAVCEIEDHLTCNGSTGCLRNFSPQVVQADSVAVGSPMGPPWVPLWVPRGFPWVPARCRATSKSLDTPTMALPSQHPGNAYDASGGPGILMTRYSFSRENMGKQRFSVSNSWECLSKKQDDGSAPVPPLAGLA